MKHGLCLSLLLLLPTALQAQTGVLRAQIEQVIQGKRATVGVAIHDFATGETLTINGDRHLPMQSVYKFHLALAVLRQVDAGTLSLRQMMHVRKGDLLPDTWSPMREAYPNGEVDLPLIDIVRYMVANSDNNACDYLFRLVGGPKQVNTLMHQLGMKDVSIQTNEEEMQAIWAVQYTNWTTPTAMLDLLKRFHEQKILSANSYKALWQIMIETTTGLNRLKKLLPPGTLVAHKTGTSGTNKAGLTGAVNDAGYITLPNGKQLGISVFVVNSTENTETNEAIIAQIAKLAWDRYSR